MTYDPSTFQRQDVYLSDEIAPIDDEEQDATLPEPDEDQGEDVENDEAPE